MYPGIETSFDLNVTKSPAPRKDRGIMRVIQDSEMGLEGPFIINQPSYYS